MYNKLNDNGIMVLKRETALTFPVSGVFYWAIKLSRHVFFIWPEKH